MTTDSVNEDRFTASRAETSNIDMLSPVCLIRRRTPVGINRVYGVFTMRVHANCANGELKSYSPDFGRPYQHPVDGALGRDQQAAPRRQVAGR